MLTVEQVGSAMAYIRVLYPHTPIPDADTDTVVGIWTHMLGDATPQEVRDAIDYLATHADRPGQVRDFPPPVGAIRGRIEAHRQSIAVIASVNAGHAMRDAARARLLEIPRTDPA